MKINSATAEQTVAANLIKAITAGKINIRRRNEPAPLTPCEIVPDETLRILAKGGPERQRGELSDRDCAILVMTLPDICGELLALRAATAKGFK